MIGAAGAASRMRKIVRHTGRGALTTPSFQLKRKREVMKMKTALLLVLLFGCVTDPAEDQFSDDDLSSTTSEITACYIPTPPAYDLLWSLTTGKRTGTFDDYGTGSCDAFVLAVRNTERVTVEAANDVDDDVECTRTRITASWYRKNGSTWSFDGSESATGVWVFPNTCRMPKLFRNVHTTGEVRVRAYVTRTVPCNGICATEIRGLPLNAFATLFVDSGPQ
ncbi:MAG: hypothetical protein ABI867_17940 [Kofleriaceae bacterium]